MAFISYLANPHRFMAFSAWALPILAILAASLLIPGTVWGLFRAPAELYQGDSARIMFVHVPSAWLASFAYAFMAISSFVYLIWRHNLADMAAKSAAIPGAVFTLIALVTGALWGKPTWGAYWVWDARVTSVLVLFFLFLGYIALRSAIDDELKAGRAAAILSLVGVINLPIIRFSVEWWNSVHQPASLFSTKELPAYCQGYDDPAQSMTEQIRSVCVQLSQRVGEPSMPIDFLIPLLAVAFGATCLFGALVMASMRAEVYRRRADIALSQRLRRA